jgi:hypothetical protein
MFRFWQLHTDSPLFSSFFVQKLISGFDTADEYRTLPYQTLPYQTLPYRTLPYRGTWPQLSVCVYPFINPIVRRKILNTF